MGCEPGPGPLTPEQAACYLMRYPDLLALVAKVGVDNASRASFMYNDSLNERFDLVQKHWASTLAAGDYLQRMGTPGEYRTHACEVHSRGDVQRALDYLTHGQCPAPPSEQLAARRASAAAARPPIPRRIMQTGRNCADRPVAGWQLLNPGWRRGLIRDGTGRHAHTRTARISGTTSSTMLRRGVSSGRGGRPRWRRSTRCCRAPPRRSLPAARLHPCRRPTVTRRLQGGRAPPRVARRVRRRLRRRRPAFPTQPIELVVCREAAPSRLQATCCRCYRWSGCFPPTRRSC